MNEMVDMMAAVSKWVKKAETAVKDGISESDFLRFRKPENIPAAREAYRAVTDAGNAPRESDKIYWRDIKALSSVQSTKAGYFSSGKLVYWLGHETQQAIAMLDKLGRRGATAESEAQQ